MGNIFYARFTDDDDLIRKLDCQKEFEDFTDESRQLEQELETNLIQNEKRVRDLKSMIINLTEDNESLRVSFASHLITTMTHAEIFWILAKINRT